MSREIQVKNKDLVNLEIKKSKDVWKKNRKGNYVLSDEFDYFGKVDKGLSAFVTMTNRKGQNSKFVEDTSILTKKTKNEIVSALTDRNTRVVYLVKRKKF